MSRAKLRVGGEGQEEEGEEEKRGDHQMNFA